MGRIEFETYILENGYISLPPQIMAEHRLKRKQPVKVTIEIQGAGEKPFNRYSFNKVRNLLKGVQGEMSVDIIAERENGR